VKDTIDGWLGRGLKDYKLSLILVGLGALYFFLMRPHIAGLWYDDGVYLLGAKALATGQGYRLLSEPSWPAIVKYPPLLSLVLAPLWWLNPHFPANLAGFKTLNIGFGLAALALVHQLARRYYGLGAWAALLLVLMVGLHPVWLTLVTDVMSEPLYLLVTMALLMLATRIHQRGTPPNAHEWVACIGLSVAAFYTRSIGIAAIGGLTIWLWRQWGLKTASRYLLSCGLWCAPWWAWTAQQPSGIYELGHFYVASYNLTYFNEVLLEIIKGQGLNLVLWENFTLLPAAFLRTLCPGLPNFATPLLPGLALLFWGGVGWLMVKRFQKACSPGFAYVICSLLACLLWYAHDQYPRLILSILPLVWMGLFNAVNSHFTHRIRNRRQRLIAQSALALALLASLQPQRILEIPRGDAMASNAAPALWQDYQAAFSAIRKFSQPQAIFWGRYSSLYPLYTNRLVISRNIAPTAKAYAAGDLQPGPKALWAIFSPILNHEHVTYFIVEPLLAGRQMVQPTDEATLSIIQSAPPHFQKVFTAPSGYIAIYRYQP
jgi:hypothetical protein